MADEIPLDPNTFRPIGTLPAAPRRPKATEIPFTGSIPPITNFPGRRNDPTLAGLDAFRPVGTPGGRMFGEGLRSYMDPDTVAQPNAAPPGGMPDALLGRGMGIPGQPNGAGSAQAPPPALQESSGSLAFRPVPFGQIGDTSMAGTSFPPGMRRRRY